MNTVSQTISDETLNSMIQIESAGKPTAKAPTSTASGLGQFIDGTWLATIAKHKPQWAFGKSRAELLQLRAASACSRFNARASIEMLARFTEDNAAILGHGWIDGDLYLAHFAGAGTARKVMRSPASPTSAVFSSAAIAANRSILAGKTCGQVRAWAAKRMKQSSGRNWIAVHWSGAKPVATAKDKAVAAAVATTATTGVGGTATAAVQQGWGALEWTLAAIAAALVVGGIVLAVRWWRRRNTFQKLEEKELAF